MHLLPTIMHLLLVVLLLCLTWKVGGAARWDGVVITQADYQGLQAIKQELVDPRDLLASWNGTGLAACSGAWVGIKCVRGEVIAIQLPFKSLRGRISSKVGQLTALRKLSLHDNSLTGQIPSSLGLLPHLRGLYLFNNRLSGTIPSSLSSCTLLLSLDLSGNSLSGHIPSSLSSTTLYRLNLSLNRLSGHIPHSLLSHPSLTFLSLNHNNLSGHIPASSDDLPLKTLHLEHNSLNGRIPSSISNLTSLVELTLQGNSLTGRLPESLTKLTNLTSFNVSDNNLSGPVPPLLAERFNSSSFSGNLYLCGYTPKSPCPSPTPPPPSPSGQPSPPPPAKEPKLSTREIILIATGSVLALLLLLCCVLICCLLTRKRRSEETNATAASAEGRGEKPPAAGPAEGVGGGEAGGKLVHFDGPLVFTADDLLCATAEIMGKSTYGTVYKATLEDGNQQVAVKRLREKVAKGQKEFESEVDVVGRIRHPNLLALRAYYLGPKGEKLLVFDYMSNGSLASFLHARGPETPVDWPTRMKIAIGAARGLHHLHSQENMVHGNLTGSNVLLDENLDTKIADFGLSRLMTAAANSSVIATAGALGYRAPELSKLKKASTKTDVYSLGVILLELLTGKSPSEAMNDMDLPQWVASIVKEEWTNEVFDLELMKGVSGATGDELLNTLKLALHCVDPSPSNRPEAQQVLRQLEEIKPAAASTSSGFMGSKEDVNGAGTTTVQGGEEEEEEA